MFLHFSKTSIIVVVAIYRIQIFAKCKIESKTHFSFSCGIQSNTHLQVQLIRNFLYKIKIRKINQRLIKINRRNLRKKSKENIKDTGICSEINHQYRDVQIRASK